jgi:hypothetical protein
MDKVQKPSNSAYYTPSSEPFRIYLISYLHFFLENRMFGTIYFIPAIDVHSSINGNIDQMTHTPRNFSVWKWYVHVIKFATLKTVDEPMFQNCSYTSVNFWQHSYTAYTISRCGKMKFRLFHFAWFHYHIYDHEQTDNEFEIRFLSFTTKSFFTYLFLIILLRWCFRL